MLPFAYYLLKVIVCSGLLYSYYYFVLRNKRFHQYNRFYLLSISMLAWVIPLFKIEFWKEAPAAEQLSYKLFSVVATTDALVTQTAEYNYLNISTEQVAIWLFIAISAAFLFTLCIALFKISGLIKSLPKQLWKNITVVFIKDQSPFSFFKYIFWNPEIDINSNEGQNIFQHEIVHVKEWHSLDKIIVNLLLVIGWINPFLWLIRKELSMIHEFIADRKSIINGDVEAFAEMLLKSVYPTHHFALANPFFYSPIKRRLLMLTTSNNASYTYARKLMILPLITMVVILFAFKAKTGDKLNRIVETMKENITSSNNQLQPGDKPAQQQTSISNKTMDEILNDETAVTTNQQGAEAATQKTSVNEIVEEDTVAMQKAMVIIDGKPMITWAEFQLMDIKPDQIASINVIKGEDAIKKYGDKGKHGVIEINTKTSATPAEPRFDKLFTRVTNPPYYANGMVAFARYVESNLQYPKEAVEKNIEGAVTIQFIVDEKGALSNFKKLTQRGYGLEEEAIRLLQQSGEWKPGEQNGHKVPVQVEQQIIFKIAANTVAKTTTTTSIIIKKNLLWPVDNGLVNLRFGKHILPGTNLTTTNDGIYIIAATGTPVKAAADGIISSIFKLGETTAIIVKHDDYYTTYANLKDITVKRGQEINAGTIIGHVSANKKGDGELVFMVSNNSGQFADPETYLTKR